MNQQSLFMQLFKFNSDKLSYEKITNKNLLILGISILTAIFVAFYVGTLVGRINEVKHENQEDTKHYTGIASKYDIDPSHDLAWKDSTFKSYKRRADIYLNRPIFEGTPLNGEILTLCARNAYDSTGILLPLELALSQATWESGMGREGRAPKNNPFNVGENDSGTTLYFESTFEGTQAYYYYMCNDYLRCRTIEELFAGFINCGGKRYATSGDYEMHIRNSYYSIKKWIDNNI